MQSGFAVLVPRAFSFFFFVLLTGFFQSSYPLTHDFCLLPVLMLMLSLAFFIAVIEFFSSGISVWFLFMISISIFLILFMYSYCFLISLNCLAFLVAHWIASKYLFFNPLLGKSQISVSLGSVIRGVLWSFGNVMFPWFFMFPVVLRCCFWHLK